MINMMKDCTILTFEEVEMIKCELDSLIEVAKDGANGEDDPKSMCDLLIINLINFRKKFE